MPLNKETAAMLVVSQTNPQGIEFYSCFIYLLFFIFLPQYSYIYEYENNRDNNGEEA